MFCGLSERAAEARQLSARHPGVEGQAVGGREWLALAGRIPVARIEGGEEGTIFNAQHVFFLGDRQPMKKSTGPNLGKTYIVTG